MVIPRLGRLGAGGPYDPGLSRSSLLATFRSWLPLHDCAFSPVSFPLISIRQTLDVMVLTKFCIVGGNAISAFLSWRLQATTSCDVTLVWKQGFEAVSQYGVSFKYVILQLLITCSFGPFLLILFSIADQKLSAMNDSSPVMVRFLAPAPLKPASLKSIDKTKKRRDMKKKTIKS